MSGQVKILLLEVLFECFLVKPNQFEQVVSLLHGMQLSPTPLHFLLHTPQMLQQLLVGKVQGLVAPDDGHDRTFRVGLKVTLKRRRTVNAVRLITVWSAISGRVKSFLELGDFLSMSLFKIQPYYKIITANVHILSGR